MAETMETSLTLKITDEDLRKFCAQEFGEDKSAGAYLMMVGMYRRFAAGNPGIGVADCIYAIVQAKRIGLDPFGGEWFTPIPRQGGQGFSLCFRLDAAQHILSNHPKIEWWDYYFESGDGKRIEKKQAPSWRKLEEVDRRLSCTVLVKLKDQKEPREYPANYGQWVSLDRDGNPKFLWLKMAGHMLAKCAQKVAVKESVGACLPFEDQNNEGWTQGALPSKGIELMPATAEETAAKVGTTAAVVEQAAQAGEAIGLSQEQTSAALEELKEAGVDPKVAAEQIEKEAAKRGRKGKTSKAAPAKEEKKSEPPKPKVELIRFTGLITGVSPRKREGTNQSFHIVELDEKQNIFVWHQSMTEGIVDAMKRMVTVQFGCVERKKDDAVFYDAEEFSLVQATPASEPKSEEGEPQTGSMDFGTGF